jgi:Zn-dependent protease/CBS domain-containing protein
MTGVALILAVFGIVVLHELGHALTARRFGIRTREITLLPFGGVAALERMPDKPVQELLVTLAGPAVNVALALALGLVVVASGGTLSPQDLHVASGPFLTKLVWINVSLALFNLLPAFPMDGGRVLRALLAFRLPYARATALAARTGQVMALILGAIGLFASPMLLVIAVFVWMGARQESTAAQVKSALAEVPIRSAMITEFRTLSADEPLSHAAELIIAGFQHEFPVLDDGKVVGVLTRDDVVKGLAEGGGKQAVGRVMRRDFGIADPNELLASALGRIHDHEIGSLVVVKDGRVLGLVTPENVGEWLLLENAGRDARGASTNAAA